MSSVPVLDVVASAAIVAREEEAISRHVITAISVVALALAACSSAPQSPTTQTGGPSGNETAATTVVVTLEEWAVKPATDSVGSGDVTFMVTNAGPRNPHELVVIKTDLDQAALPSTSTGMLNQTDGAIEVIDEIDGIGVGANQDLTVTLAAGKYVLLCNVYDDSGAHFKNGMVAAFTVTE